MSASRSVSLRGANADISIKSKTVGGGFFCYAKKIGLQMLNSDTRLEVNSCRGLSESFFTFRLQQLPVPIRRMLGQARTSRGSPGGESAS